MSPDGLFPCKSIRAPYVPWALVDASVSPSRVALLSVTRRNAGITPKLVAYSQNICYQAPRTAIVWRCINIY